MLLNFIMSGFTCGPDLRGKLNISLTLARLGAPRCTKPYLDYYLCNLNMGRGRLSNGRPPTGLGAFSDHPWTIPPVVGSKGEAIPHTLCISALDAESMLCGRGTCVSLPKKAVCNGYVSAGH